VAREGDNWTGMFYLSQKWLFKIDKMENREYNGGPVSENVFI
jgi:hypothetical protein